MMFQGHPGYDDLSLYKEYQREVSRLFQMESEDYPVVPENYFSNDILQ